MKLDEIFNLYEAKEVRDYRHEESDLKHWGASPYHYINPKDGFFFHYGDGSLILHSEENDVYSRTVTKGVKPSRDLWNSNPGVVDYTSKTITFLKINMQGSVYKSNPMVNIKALQGILRSLKPFGVSDDYVVKGLPKHISKSVGEILNMKDFTDQVLDQSIKILYHGTSMKRWETIQRIGLRPGNTGENYVDLQINYSEYNIYLATTEKAAEFYGKRQAKKDGDTQYVIIQVTVPDPAKIMADDSWNPQYYDNNKVTRDKDEMTKLGQRPKGLSGSGREQGEFAYRGAILPKFLKPIRKGKA